MDILYRKLSKYNFPKFSPFQYANFAFMAARWFNPWDDSNSKHGQWASHHQGLRACWKASPASWEQSSQLGLPGYPHSLRFPQSWGHPTAGWFIMENPCFTWIIRGTPGTPISGNPHLEISHSFGTSFFDRQIIEKRSVFINCPYLFGFTGDHCDTSPSLCEQTRRAY